MNTRETTVATLARHVGLVFQNPDHQLFAETVEKEIMFALTNFNFPEDEISRRVNWALKEFGLLEYKDRPPFLLSGGERKRLALASVLCYDPQIVILDEPTTGQDYRQKLEKGNIFQRVRNYIPVLIPLIISSFRRAELVADAMESRAFGAAKRRTSLYVLTMGRRILKRWI